MLDEAGAGPADLTAVAVGTGPGPFTGLRVGMVTAVTMGYALGVPVHGVCSLDVLAEQAAATTEGRLLVATDARRREVYWARYEAAARAARAGSPTRRSTDPADLPDDVRALPTAGRGPLLYPEVLTAALDSRPCSTSTRRCSGGSRCAGWPRASPCRWSRSTCAARTR